MHGCLAADCPCSSHSYFSRPLLLSFTEGESLDSWDSASSLNPRKLC